MFAHQETYQGYVIKASAIPAAEGYVASATISRIAPSATDFKIEPPQRVFATVPIALEEAVAASRHMIDEL